jgi:hypothetical protein
MSLPVRYSESSLPAKRLRPPQSRSSPPHVCTVAATLPGTGRVVGNTEVSAVRRAVISRKPVLRQQSELGSATVTAQSRRAECDPQLAQGFIGSGSFKPQWHPILVADGNGSHAGVIRPHPKLEFSVPARLDEFMERRTARIRRPRRAFQILVNENQIAHAIEKESSVHRVLRKSGFLQAFCELKSHHFSPCASAFLLKPVCSAVPEGLKILWCHPEERSEKMRLPS